MAERIASDERKMAARGRAREARAARRARETAAAVEIQRITRGRLARQLRTELIRQMAEVPPRACAPRCACNAAADTASRFVRGQEAAMTIQRFVRRVYAVRAAVKEAARRRAEILARESACVIQVQCSTVCACMCPCLCVRVSTVSVSLFICVCVCVCFCFCVCVQVFLCECVSGAVSECCVF